MEVLKEMPEGPEEVEKILKIVSDMVPTLVKGVLGAIFSPEAGKNMGAAAANFYKEVKAGGLPEDVAVKMTQDYVKTFTDIGSLIKDLSSQKGGIHIGDGSSKDEVSKIVEEEIRKKVAEKQEQKTV
jgi:hypothetical protein